MKFVLNQEFLALNQIWCLNAIHCDMSMVYLNLIFDKNKFQIYKVKPKHGRK